MNQAILGPKPSPRVRMKVDSPSKKKVGSPLKEKKKDLRKKIAGPISPIHLGQAWTRRKKEEKVRP